MEKLAILAGAMLLVLVAACNPADTVSTARAEPRAMSLALQPEPAAGARDGHVHEYH